MTKVQLTHFRNANGCVVSYCPIASSIGAQVLRLGGNAVDAAVATSLALAVTYPQAGNLGGGGFMLLRRARGDTYFLDYRETAPSRIESRMFVDEDDWRNQHTVIGGASVCVPGTVAGMAAALERFGVWSWDRVVGSVIDLADKGVWLTTRQSAFMGMFETDFGRFESTRAAMLSKSGDPMMPGTLWAQPDLANTLRLLADQGPDAFYRGEIAERIVNTVQKHNGVLGLEDLAGYKAVWRDPLVGSFFGRTLFTAPPPSGGGLVILISTALLEAAGVKDLGAMSADRYRLLARVFRIAFELRRRLTGDPDTTPPEAKRKSDELLESSLSKAGDLDGLERDLGIDGSGPTAKAQDFHKNTTHLCVLDGAGNAVSNTYSLNTLFGSKLVPEGCGFLLNNSIDDFAIGASPNYYGLVEGGGNNYLQPGRRPTGSMSPTIAVHSDGDIELVLGASGGPRIPTVLTQLLTHVLCDGEILPIAMRSPRVHQQHIDNEVWVEPTLPDHVQQGLVDLGCEVSRHAQLGIAAGIHFWKGGVYAALDFRFSQ